MTTTTRRRFLRSAALAATAPVVTSTAACAPESPSRVQPAGGVGGTDPALQADLEEASAAVFANGGILTATAGLVNVSTGVEMTSETVMHIGSITKILNTTLLMQMVDDGLVDLSAPVSAYLPELQLSDPDHLSRITTPRPASRCGHPSPSCPSASHRRGPRR